MKGKIIFVRYFNFKGVKKLNKLYKIIIIEKLSVNVFEGIGSLLSMLLFLILKVVEVNVFLLDLFFLLRDKWLKIFVKFLFLILIIIVENIKNIKVF